MEYEYTSSTSHYGLCPVKVLESMLHFAHGDGEEDIRPIPLYENNSGDWGDESPVEEDGTSYPPPEMLWLRWWSVPEQKCYDIEMYLQPKKSKRLWKEYAVGKESERYKYFVFGMSPYGGVAVWMKSRKKSVLLDWSYALEDELHEYEKAQLERLGLVSEPKALPPKDYFDQNMQQYTYRYVALEEYWDGNSWQSYPDDSDEMFCDHVEELLYDGTSDKTGSEYLFDYHQAGVPQKLAAVWYEDRDEYKVLFWLKRNSIMNAFLRIYYNQPDAEVDFIIRFDLKAGKHQLALHRKGIGQIVLPEEGYEVLVLRNDNLQMKSANFSLSMDAWRW